MAPTAFLRKPNRLLIDLDRCNSKRAVRASSKKISIRGCTLAFIRVRRSSGGLCGDLPKRSNATKGAKAVAEGMQVAAGNPLTTEREKVYIAAISEIFNEDAIKRSQSFDNKPDLLGYSRPSPEAETKYTQRMADLHTRFPADKEATIFYALALDVGGPRDDKTHADQRHCIELLQPLFREMPDHPGVAHYIIHCSDNPEMAKDGLEAARKHAQIAPASAHATHMPSSCGTGHRCVPL
jgi:hypothetical protein